MVAVRKAVGITSMSQMIPMGSTKDYYVVQVLGNGGKKLLCVVGNTAASYTPTDTRWKKAISGYHYVYYVQGIEPSAITLPEFEEEEQPQDGTFSGIPSFCKVNDGEICLGMDERWRRQRLCRYQLAWRRGNVCWYS